MNSGFANSRKEIQVARTNYHVQLPLQSFHSLNAGSQCSWQRSENLSKSYKYHVRPFEDNLPKEAAHKNLSVALPLKTPKLLKQAAGVPCQPQSQGRCRAWPLWHRSRAAHAGDTAVLSLLPTLQPTHSPQSCLRLAPKLPALLSLSASKTPPAA